MISRPKFDYYEVLGLSRTATLKEIKAAFRKKAFQYHPDKIAATATKREIAERTRLFQRINEAYQCLSNARLRSQYDSLYHETPQPKASAPRKPSYTAKPSAAQASGASFKLTQRFLREYEEIFKQARTGLLFRHVDAVRESNLSHILSLNEYCFLIMLSYALLQKREQSFWFISLIEEPWLFSYLQFLKGHSLSVQDHQTVALLSDIYTEWIVWRKQLAGMDPFSTEACMIWLQAGADVSFTMSEETGFAQGLRKRHKKTTKKETPPKTRQVKSPPKDKKAKGWVGCLAILLAAIVIYGGLAVFAIWFLNHWGDWFV